MRNQKLKKQIKREENIKQNKIKKLMKERLDYEQKTRRSKRTTKQNKKVDRKQIKQKQEAKQSKPIRQNEIKKLMKERSKHEQKKRRSSSRKKIEQLYILPLDQSPASGIHLFCRKLTKTSLFFISKRESE